ncbi:MAG: DNA alkylation repair protein [Albidovulum sp.]|uniref:DNA alkylation repair protein n=1 Tax=Albidovulum sp. TaxID=1872424 RepID=UPI003CB5B8CC
MEPFKTFFSPDLVACLAKHVSRHHPGFDARAFRSAILPKLDALELKARAQLIADILNGTLPEDAGERARVLTAILHPDPLDHANQPSDDDGICGWGVLPLTMVVGQHGVDDFDRSMDLLAEVTKRFSSEFGIRYFLIADQARAIRILEGWLDDPNHHVRRLISEGTRPRLPWAMQLPSLLADPSPVLPLLTRLRDDPEVYVRRSVANHLNDISKDHPGLVTDIARDWMKGADKDRQALLRHACRSLIKKGDAATLAIFGREKPQLALPVLHLSSNAVRMGQVLDLTAELRSTSRKPQQLTIDYVLHFLKADGRLSPKVFKGSNLTLGAGEVHIFRRAHRFREVTTRRHYAGKQAVSLCINGMDTDPVAFHLNI